jgi:site-specific recombinase XerD
MKQWDRLLDTYLEQYGARGLAEGSVSRATRVLTDWGQWMKRCRPRPMLERVDADLIVRYISTRSSFRAKSTVYGTISTMRGMGDHLVREGVWRSNPLRWMKGPKVPPYSRVPKRLDHSQMESLWREAAASRGTFAPSLWITVVALLYGTGLRRGELERLDVTSFDREHALLR